ncbi:hypothetical protein EG328_007050 [Venturia inaequalis]|uniref:Uncharacterized protein n=1 Tax=Venturia inaequalis TaxID=5025 RepID=A0A8H3VRI8_VENIN|nr:hypothetical protein EG328_007050 [Venturia inaequalis]KAE9992257.1 hypothetical protein EG327_009635 [Venturia inaequalis]RDI83344.1 AdoMet-dependent rRNA methyltransferase [Venturia inaequalis]
MSTSRNEETSRLVSLSSALKHMIITCLGPFGDVKPDTEPSVDPEKSPEEHEHLKDLLNLRLACLDFSEHAEAHIDLDYMLSWVTVDLQEDILKKLVQLSRYQNRRHGIRLLNISTAQLHGSIPVKDNSISVPDQAESSNFSAQLSAGSRIAQLSGSQVTPPLGFKGSTASFQL